MFKLTPRMKLWSYAIWTVYCIAGIVMYYTDTLSDTTIMVAQVLLYGTLALPCYNKRIAAWLSIPRTAVLRIRGELLAA